MTTKTAPIYIIREPGDDECYIGRAATSADATEMAIDYAAKRGWDVSGIDAPQRAEMAFEDVDGDEVMLPVWIITGIDTRD